MHRCVLFRRSLTSQLEYRDSNENTGQSCAIAALSGSTNESYEETVKGSGAKTPTGSNSKGKECITKYYKQLGLKAPGGGITPPAANGATQPERRIRVESTEEDGDVNLSGIEKRQGCKPYTLLYARGTLEMGTMGSTVGPALQSALARQGGGKWRVEGIKYTADIAGDDCIGFPGGIKCVDQLSTLATQCPDSKYFLSGYSQGAMVARICTAFSKDAVKQKIKVSILHFCHYSAYCN
jgi:hypothetical protein